MGKPTCAILAAMCFCAAATSLGNTILFNFDNAPVHTPLPLNLTVEGLTAHLSGTGPGYSIQDANVLGFTPAGFSGNSLYPDGINAAGRNQPPGGLFC